jgi:hypothetical protein
MRGTRLAAPLVALASVALVLGCGDDEQAAAVQVTYVGQVSGTNAYIALVAEGGKLSGYVSDSKQVSTWLTAPRLASSVELESRQGDPLGDVSGGDTAGGSVEVAGKDRTFTLERATGEAGLYRAARGKPGKKGFVEVGWVVLADGSQRGGTNFIDPNTLDNVTKPAPKLDPNVSNVSVNVDGRAIKLAQQRVQRFIDPSVD